MGEDPFIDHYCRLSQSPTPLPGPLTIEEENQHSASSNTTSPLQPDDEFSALDPGHISNENQELINEAFVRIGKVLWDLSVKTGYSFQQLFTLKEKTKFWQIYTAGLNEGTWQLHTLFEINLLIPLITDEVGPILHNCNAAYNVFRNA